MNASVPQSFEEGFATARDEGPRDGVRFEPVSFTERDVGRALSPAEKIALKARTRAGQNGERPELLTAARGMVEGAVSRALRGAPRYG